MAVRPRSHALLLAALLAAAPSARADDSKKEPAPPAEKPAEKPPENVSDEKAKEALDRFQREFATEDLDLQLEALKPLCRVMHPTVAGRLLDLALKSPENLVRSSAFRGLAYQKTSVKTTGPRVAKFLSEAAEENANRKKRGDYGVRVDPKTGDTDTESAEGKAALRAKRDRSRMLSEAVRLLDTIGHRGPDSVESLQEFLQDGDDDLVALALGMFGKWKVWGMLKPDILQLFEMYPKEHEFQTGSTSVDTGAAGSEDQQAAKRAWMAKYGDPDKRRPRPKVVKAIKQAILDITGEKVDTLEAYKDLLKRPDVKRKIRAGQ